MSVDLHAPIRLAVIEDEALTLGVPNVHRGLGSYKGVPACFTRRPVPDEAELPLCIVNPPRLIGNLDGLTARREEHLIDLAFYGRKGAPGTDEDQTRDVEALAHRAHELFHRNKEAVQGDGFRLIDVVASGPVPGATDDDRTVARIVTLRLRLGRN